MKKMFSKVMAASLVISLALTATSCASNKPAATDTSKPAATAADKAAATAASKETPKKIDYPTKAITVLHGFSPGGGSDQLHQLVKPFAEKILKQNLTAVYKTGADGAIAWKEVAGMTGTKADGYTITTVLTPKTQLNHFINKSAGYKMEDFVGVANMVFDPGMLVVKPDSQFNTFKDFVEYAKTNPGKIKMSHSGDGGDDWFNGVMIGKLANVKFNLVPFAGDGPAWQAAAGGNVDACTNNLSIVGPLIKGGKLKALAVYTDQRIPDFPDIPTLKELGVNFVEGSYRGFIVPKDTPKEIVDILANTFEQISKDPEFVKAAKAANLEIKFLKGDEFKKFIENEDKQLGQTVKEMGLEGSM